MLYTDQQKLTNHIKYLRLYSEEDTEEARSSNRPSSNLRPGLSNMICYKKRIWKNQLKQNQIDFQDVTLKLCQLYQ